MYSKHVCYTTIKPALDSTGDTWQESGMRGEELGGCQILMRWETWMEARLWEVILLQQCCDHGWTPEVMIQLTGSSLLMISWWSTDEQSDEMIPWWCCQWGAWRVQLWWHGDHWRWWLMAAGIWTQGASSWVVGELSNPGPHIGRQCNDSLLSNDDNNL